MLEQVTIVGKDNKSLVLWECSEPHDLYKEELLEHVVKMLFLSPEKAECGYLKLSPSISNMWFNKLEVVLPARRLQGKSSERRLPIRLLSERIELFFSKYGVGVLSVALALDREPVSLDEALEFNYRLSQAREHTAAKLRTPHPSDNPEKWSALPEHIKAQVPEPPATNAPLLEQLGRVGGEFTLFGLAHELLRPLEKLGFRSAQEELSPYTVARFGEKVDLQNAEACADMAAFLSALAQVEEPGHAGAARGEIGVTNEMLNRRHWVGVGLLGAAHIVADQVPLSHPFNTARVPRVVLKYFIPYLLALLQRLTLHRIIDEASILVMSKEDDAGRALSDLRNHLLEFALVGHFTEVSTREALHRYYRMCQQGLDVRNALSDARQAIADLDARHSAENQAQIAQETSRSVAATRDLQQDMAKNVEATRKLHEQMAQHLDVVARVQLMVEWLEVFVVSVAAADLWHLFSYENKGWFPTWAAKFFRDRDSFVSWGVVLAALFAGAITLSFIQPWRHRKHGS